MDRAMVGMTPHWSWSATHMPPLLIINPPSDIGFVEECHEALADAATSPARLQAALRVRYPDAIVRPRELSGETIIVWYVYRDGHWVSSD